MNNPAIIFRLKAELAEWRALQLESRILAEIYEPLWYHYNAAVADHKDIAVFIFKPDDRIELLDSKADLGVKDGTRSEMSQMVASFYAANEYYRLGVKQRNPGESYSIGIDCPNQGGAKHNVYQALVDGQGVYSDLVQVVDRLAEITRVICDEEPEPQWLVFGGENFG